MAVAFVSDPPIRHLQQRFGAPRWPIAAILYVLILAVLGGAGYWVETTAVPDLMHVVARAPEILRRFLGELIGSEGITVFHLPDAVLLALVVGILALRLSIDNLAGPIVLGEAARIHPVVVIMSFVCGAILFGVVGLLLAVPIAVCIKVTLQEYYAEPIARGEPGRSG